MKPIECTYYVQRTHAYSALRSATTKIGVSHRKRWCNIFAFHLGWSKEAA